MSNNDILKELNNITYTEEELEKYVAKREEVLDNDIYMNKHFVAKTITEREARNYIEKRLHPTEKVVHLMGLENLDAKAAQSGVAIASGVGALPFLNMQLNTVLAITTDRLFICMMDGNLEASTVREYQLEEVEYLKTGMDGDAEFLVIKLKNRSIADFRLFCPGYNYESLAFAAGETLRHKGVELLLKDDKLTNQIKNSYLWVWGFIVLMLIWMVYKWF